jgi:methylase of polypeptide subunit release factors
VPELLSGAGEVVTLTAEVGGLEFAWDRRVLEPRPWTAEQSTWLAELAVAAPGGPALELCSGAGHLGLLMRHLTGRKVVQVDVDPVATGLTRANAERLGLRTEVRTAPMRDALAPDERFALVLADPPWVERARVVDYPADPVRAIDGGPDGTALARECLALADRHLLDGGHLVLQVRDRDQLDRLVADLPTSARRLRLVECRIRERGALGHFTTTTRVPGAAEAAR